jgi:hypothetical protein
MGTLGWIDFSSEDRRKVTVVLAHLKDRGTLDELGIGQVRDSFSDALFPGFSTIQTRARYFLAVPTIINRWARGTPAERQRLDLASFLEREEDRLAERLHANHLREELPLADIVGHTRIEKGGVKRRPSSSYWGGLRTFKIVHTEKSLAEFCRSWVPPAAGAPASDEHGDDDGDGALDEVETPPQPYADDPGRLTLKLHRKEAEYLHGRFCAVERPEVSIVSQLLQAGLVRDALRYHGDFRALAHWLSRQPGLHGDCKEITGCAADFSLAIEGAHIAYNRALAGKTGNDTLLEKCGDAWSAWRAAADVAQVFTAGAVERWLAAAVLLGVRVSPLTCEFLREWHERKPHQQRDMPPALLAFVAGRVHENKPGRSLLARPPRKPAAWFGMRDLPYRWSVTVKMLNDLKEAGAC